jgi:hypothetical protein
MDISTTDSDCLTSLLTTILAKADSTLRSSQAIPHPSTDRALSRLTSEVERDPARSTWYGRQRLHTLIMTPQTVPSRFYTYS